MNDTRVYEKLAHLTETLGRYRYRAPMAVAWRVFERLGMGEPLPDLEADGWHPLEAGALWGACGERFALATAFTVPQAFAGRPLVLRVAFQALKDDPQAKLFSAPQALAEVRGLEAPPQGLDTLHREIWLADKAPAERHVQVVLDGFAGVSQPAGHRVRMTQNALAWLDKDVEGLYWDARVLLDVIATLPQTSAERAYYLRTLDEAFRMLDWAEPLDGPFFASVKRARAHLQARVFEQAPPESAAPRPVVHALGHAHLDVAWLWPLSVTRIKAADTFANALALMARDPNFTYTQSQPYLYRAIAQDRPQLFAKVKARIAEGRWEASGGTWVEMDTNIPGAEALVRQLLYGMRYFQRELGVRPRVLWLPDTFGFSAALPQLMQQAGLRYFFTSKLSWNEYTRFPYDTFWWEGLDGSRVLAHMATTPNLAVRPQGIERTTYDARMTAQEVWETWTRYRQKRANHHVLIAYGLGDGGGGPDRAMCERRARMENLAGFPQVVPSTAECFFADLEATCPPNLPRWVGELYLQYHRGTYTSQARVKRHNRKLEALLHDAEALASVAYLLEGHYPQEALERGWETLLVHQFHDILAGTCTAAVYQEVEHAYREAEEAVRAVRDTAMETVAQHVRWDVGMQGLVVFNTLSTSEGGPIEVTLPGTGAVEIVGPSGRRKPIQWLDKEARRALVIPNHVPPYGHKAYIVRQVEEPPTVPVYDPVICTAERLENGRLRAEFDAHGNLARLYDKEFGRDVLAAGELGNQLWLYVDRPRKWDAWDVDESLQEQGWRLEPQGVRVVEAGPLRGTLEVRYTFNKSRIVQRVQLLTDRRLLSFQTRVDWHEQHLMLRVRFPLAVRAARATYEVQFGAVERPTHRNTAWDAAQFEVPAQRWADLSEGGYGVSLLNDSKYGYSVQDGVLALSLLRAPTHPDPEADQGVHEFTYALWPHGENWREEVVAQAGRLNHPLLVRYSEGGGTWLPVTFGVVRSETPCAVVETLKRAEDEDALIVRVYEARGGRCTARLTFGAPIARAEAVNLLEEAQGAVETAGAALRCALTPYQVRTFRVWLQDVVEHQLGT